MVMTDSYEIVVPPTRRNVDFFTASGADAKYKRHSNNRQILYYEGEDLKFTVFMVLMLADMLRSLANARFPTGQILFAP